MEIVGYILVDGVIKLKSKEVCDCVRALKDNNDITNEDSMPFRIHEKVVVFKKKCKICLGTGQPCRMDEVLYE